MLHDARRHLPRVMCVVTNAEVYRLSRCTGDHAAERLVLTDKKNTTNIPLFALALSAIVSTVHT